MVVAVFPAGGAGVDLGVEVELDQERLSHVETYVAVGGTVLGIVGLVPGHDVLELLGDAVEYLAAAGGEVGAQLGRYGTDGDVVARPGHIAVAVDQVEVACGTENSGLAVKFGLESDILVGVALEVGLDEVVAQGHVGHQSRVYAHDDTIVGRCDAVLEVGVDSVGRGEPVGLVGGDFLEVEDSALEGRHTAVHRGQDVRAVGVGAVAVGGEVLVYERHGTRHILTRVLGEGTRRDVVRRGRQQVQIARTGAKGHADCESGRQNDLIEFHIEFSDKWLMVRMWRSHRG